MFNNHKHEQPQNDEIWKTRKNRWRYLSILHYLLASVYVFLGLIFILADTIHLRGITLDLTENSSFFIFSGIILILWSIYLVVQTNKNKVKKIIDFSKCPKCREAYNYIRLRDGMCPTCNIETIDMDKYFKKFPDIEI